MKQRNPSNPLRLKPVPFIYFIIKLIRPLLELDVDRGNPQSLDIQEKNNA